MKGKSKNIARITGIIDGDSFTVSVKGEEKIICLANVDPLGDEGGRAEGFLARLLKVGQRVRLQQFGENDDGDTIANVYKGRKGKDVALMMVKKGFAEISDDMEYRTDLEKLSKFEIKAQQAGKGIWADLFAEDSDDMSNVSMVEMEGDDDLMEAEFQEVLEMLESSDELTGRGTKATGNPFADLEISSAELKDGELLVSFSDDVTFREYGQKSFKAFAGGKKLNLKKTEFLDSDLISFEVPHRRNLSDGAVFKMLFVGEGKDKEDLDYMSDNTIALIAEIEVV